MNSKIERIPKACDPCRARKIRCNGGEPCRNCQGKPSACVYRLRARHRARKSAAEPATSSPANVNVESQRGHDTTAFSFESIDADGIAAAEREVDTGADAAQRIHPGVMASHPISPESAETGENSQLFYGPSSNFAFLQQVHRGVLFSHPQGHPCESDVQEGGPGLDMFMQRSIFFGTSSRVDPVALHQPKARPISDILSLSEAQTFLNHFKTSSYHLFPFYTRSELDQILQRVYNDEPNTPLPIKALLLSTLANGGLSTDRTELAETLFARAKQEAALFDDLVTLTMIQYFLVAGDYQLHMGRPNSAYLHVGSAGRMAFAMGLHKECPYIGMRQDSLQKQRITMWCLYIHERWQALSLGRQSAIKKADITRLLPEGLPLIVGLSKLARISEDAAAAIYVRRYNSLRELYTSAQKIHAALMEFAEQMDIGSVQQAITEPASLLQLHNLYYHTVILTFRPFLISETALQLSGNRRPEEQMWLRQACRYAIDAAQDLIVYNSSKIETSLPCKGMRFNAFFLESSCAVLLYDILQYPSRHGYHLGFIQSALKSLDLMVNDAPVTYTRLSLRQMLRIVENATTKQLTLRTPSSDDEPYTNYHSIQFPPVGVSSSTEAEKLIHFSDISNPQVPNAQEPPTYGLEGDVSQSGLHFDVLTTDLYSFFPVDMITPTGTGDHTAEDVGDSNWSSMIL